MKLDTNGLDSHMLEECLPFVDYVALDVKTSPEKYPLLGASGAAELIQTAEILKMGKVEYEFRTTVVPGFADASDMQAMCEIVKGARTWALQQFVPGDTLDKSLNDVKPYLPDEVRARTASIEDYAERIVFRF